MHCPFFNVQLQGMTGRIFLTGQKMSACCDFRSGCPIRMDRMYHHPNGLIRLTEQGEAGVEYAFDVFHGEGHMGQSDKGGV